MTPLQHRILYGIIEPYIEKNGYAPARREIADHLGQTISSVTQTLQRMERKGLVRLGRGWRSIEIVRRRRGALAA